MKSLFLSVIGQDDNIGDSALRRGLISGLRSPDIQLHLYVGGNSSGYVTGLGVSPADVLYTERSEWLASMRVNRGRGNSSYSSNAGEVSTMTGPRYLGRDQLASLLKVRSNGGALVHTGVGIRSPYTSSRIAKWSALRWFDIVTWRDEVSRDYAGVGAVAPDWGFNTDAGGTTDDSVGERSTIVVSLRGDREYPSPEWFTAVKTIIAHYGVQPVILVQVKRDGERAVEIASELGSAARVVPWESDDHHTQEEVARHVYRDAIAVVSDRLHALILGATEGAYPLGFPPSDPRKLTRTLAPARFEYFEPSVAGLEVEALPTTAQMLDDVIARTRQARAELEELSMRIRRCVETR
ncbi:hypothetical protein MN032_00075 [Agromyces atrinae]|uniref:polysaccharide pyruvyl transferase family protein n=1 Tax=Agromyces atrinae TaxID=592376 RepID=UPI001F58103C|nr:polysaccharide pyruvyl transferase family protein [Agromyces atrinae]MCI2956075.1 hypothetical protein [Agromyces atrinae]